MTNDATKPCTKCGEEIAKSAKICPICKEWQQRSWLKNTQVLVYLITFPLILIPIFWFNFRIRDRGEEFAKHRDEVVVLESKLRFGDQHFRGLVLIGRLQNNSKIQWGDVVIEVQYFDAQGMLIATKTERDMSLVLLPGETHAFEVSSERNFEPETYVSHKVFIRDAKDAKKWP